MNAPVLIITRPRAQAEPLANRLQQRGVASFIFPLLEISANRDNSALTKALAEASRFALTIFISPTAVNLAFSANQPSFLSETQGWPTPIAVLGPGSVIALAQAGITAKNTYIISPTNQTTGTENFDSEALLLALQQTPVKLEQLRDKEVLVVRGRGGRELLLNRLSQAGAKLTVMEAYQRCAPTPDASSWQQLQQILMQPHCWLLTSSEAVRHLQALCSERPYLYRLQTALVPHPRIGEAALQAGFSKVVPTNITDDDLIYALHNNARGSGSAPS